MADSPIRAQTVSAADSIHDTAELRSACAAAQAQAEAHFGEGPPPLWEPTQEPHVSGRLPRLYALMAGVLLAGAVAGWLIGGEAAASSAPSSTHPSVTLSEAATSEADVEHVPSVAEVAASPAPVTLFVGRSDRLWSLDAQGASRMEAARQLALQSGSTLHGSVDLLAQAPPLTLRWQGRSLAQAWAQVLGADLNYALQCRRDGCEAWIVAAAGRDTTSAPFRTAPAGAAVLSSGADDIVDDRDTRADTSTGRPGLDGDGGASHH